MFAAVNNNIKNVTDVLRKIRSTREELRSISSFYCNCHMLGEMKGVNRRYLDREFDEEVVVLNNKTLTLDEYVTRIEKYKFMLEERI